MKRMIVLLLAIAMLSGCSVALTTTQGDCTAEFGQPWWGSVTNVKASACGATWEASEVDSNAQSLQSVIDLVK